MSTEVVVKDGSAEVAVSEAEIQALLNQQSGEFDPDMRQVPILKIGQPLTREVQAEEAEAGEFINSLTSEGLGTKIGFIVSYYQKGRFATDRDSGRSYVAFTETIPEAWEDLVGADYVGTSFSEYPDAEETYKERVNKKEIEWGKGPLVSTTHNFTGYAVVEDPETGEDELQPVRLSLQRTNVPVVRKWITLIKSLRGKAQWDVVFDLGTEKKTFDRGSSHLLTVKVGRATTADERALAVALAQEVAAGRVADNQVASGAEAPVEPDAKGGLGL